MTTNATCTYCGCVCDDITVRIEGERIVRADRACSLGRAWFFRYNANKRFPEALIDGSEARLEDAIQRAAELLGRARYPLVYGLGSVSCEAQRAAAALAETLGAALDTHTSRTHGPNKIAAQMMGKVTCTLGEVRNRADFVLYWGCNPVVSHPRHWTRYAVTPRGKFVSGGRRDRMIVVVDVRPTASSRAADDFLPIRPGGDFEILTAARALLRDRPVHEPAVEAAGVSMARLRKLVDRMKAARFGAIFFGAGLNGTRGKHANVAALLALTRELNGFTKFAAMPMRDHGNESGSDNVLSWTTGYPFAIDFSRGYPRYNPGEFTAVDLLVRRDVDAAVVVGADPATSFPKAAVEHLGRIPTIVLDPRVTATSRLARVHITTAAAGIHAAGTAYRMDKVPLPMKALLPCPYPGDVEILERLHKRLSFGSSQPEISPASSGIERRGG